MTIAAIIESSKTMTDKEKFKLAAELADAADVVQQSVNCDHEDMFGMHNRLSDISDDLFELAGE
jgi:hypothetical protein